MLPKFISKLHTLVIITKDELKQSNHIPIYISKMTIF